MIERYCDLNMYAMTIDLLHQYYFILLQGLAGLAERLFVCAKVRIEYLCVLSASMRMHARTLAISQSQ